MASTDAMRQAVAVHEALAAAEPPPTIPVHLFFSHDALHEAMPAAVREVEINGTTVPLVAPEHLLARKLLLGREKDRRDVERWLAQAELASRTGARRS
jgi:hypothetical protein